jgi:hypothetical protein
MSARQILREHLTLRAPDGMNAALEVGAIARRLHPSEYARRLILQGLEQDGIELAPPEPRLIRPHTI